MAGGIASTRFWGNLVRWLIDERVEAAQQLLELAWESHDYLATPVAKTIFSELFAPFARKTQKPTSTKLVSPAGFQSVRSTRRGTS